MMPWIKIEVIDSYINLVFKVKAMKYANIANFVYYEKTRLNAFFGGEWCMWNVYCGPHNTANWAALNHTEKTVAKPTQHWTQPSYIIQTHRNPTNVTFIRKTAQMNSGSLLRLKACYAD